jgi:hypothetical protein
MDYLSICPAGFLARLFADDLYDFGRYDCFNFVPQYRIVLDLNVTFHKGSCIPWIAGTGDGILPVA